MSIVLVIVIANFAMSLLAFQSPDLMNKWLLRPYEVRHRNQWYRFITSGFIHANWPHLIFNMIALYTFGAAALNGYQFYFRSRGVYYFILLYLGGMIIADLPTYAKYRDQSWYASLGASGAVSAVAFASVVIEPRSTIYMMFAIPLPAVLWAVIYLLSSQYMAKRGGDNINHSAHLYGALFGLVYTIALKPGIAVDFINKLTNNY